jgi:hypothetical protein
MLILCCITNILVFSDNEQNVPQKFSFITGPRVGYTYSFMSQSAFTNSIYSETNNYSNADYFQGNSVFGISLEERVLLGDTSDHFACQEILSIDGLEQSLVIPVAEVLVGYRSHIGFEFGIGPRVSIDGISVVGAIGWTLEFKGVFIPIELSATLANTKVAASIALTTGFNFQVN